MPERANAGAGVRGNANPVADANLRSYACADRRACPRVYANGDACAYCKGIAYANARAYSSCRSCARACANANCDCGA